MKPGIREARDALTQNLKAKVRAKKAARRASVQPKPIVQKQPPLEDASTQNLLAQIRDAIKENFAGRNVDASNVEFVITERDSAGAVKAFKVITTLAT